ncbi:uncharacterized protein DS421_12g380790 [Arachis hypogaea]|nr:uncharacterized protein DS421_12g380790 [Arachis hypogaea]
MEAHDLPPRMARDPRGEGKSDWTSCGRGEREDFCRCHLLRRSGSGGGSQNQSKAEKTEEKRASLKVERVVDSLERVDVRHVRRCESISLVDCIDLDIMPLLVDPPPWRCSGGRWKNVDNGMTSANNLFEKKKILK